jgi:hypothetical protein
MNNSFIFKPHSPHPDIGKVFPSLGVLPKDYQTFLSMCDGGRIEPYSDKDGDTFASILLIDLVATRTIGTGVWTFLGLSETLAVNQRIQTIQETFVNDWYYEDEELPFAQKLIPIADAHNYIAIDNNRGGEIRYFDNSYNYFDNIKNYEPIAKTFMEFLEKLIAQNGGYVKNLSEIYNEIKNKMDK